METNKVNLKFEFDKKKLNVLKLADNYGLIKLRRGLLRGVNIIKSEITRSNEFLNLAQSSRFEILKNTFISQFIRNKSFSREEGKDLTLVELRVILNFLGLLIHENRTVDLAVKESQMEPFEEVNSPQECIQMLSSEQDINEVILNVGHGKKQLYVDRFTLTQNSPVLKEMLNKDSKGVQKKSLDFPQRSQFDMIQFISFLKKPKDIKGKILFGIFSHY